MKKILILPLVVWACEPAPPPPRPPLVPPAPPVAVPEAVAPGQYTNHVGNPAVGHWGPDGQWVFNEPKSPEADSTWKYLAAAGMGAAAGGLAAHLLTKKQFEQQNPSGWSADRNTKQVTTYVDKRGNPISEAEYQRRRAQSERDKAAHQERIRAKESRAAQLQPKPAPKPEPKPKPAVKWSKPWKPSSSGSSAVKWKSSSRRR